MAFFLVSVFFSILVSPLVAFGQSQTLRLPDELVLLKPVFKDMLPEKLRAELYDFMTKELQTAADPSFASRITLQLSPDGTLDKDRPVTLLLHGLYSSPRFFTELEQEALKKRHHVLNIRLPGHFEKDFMALDRLKGAELLERASFAFAVASQISTKINLVGHSTGGLLLTHIAFKNPEKISSLLLFAPAFQVDQTTLDLIEAAQEVGFAARFLTRRQLPGQIYYSFLAAQEVQRLSSQLGFVIDNKDIWVGPLSRIRILMFDTQVETAVDLHTNLNFAWLMKDSPSFEHILFPFKERAFHNEMGRFSKTKYPHLWNKIRNFWE